VASVEVNMLVGRTAGAGILAAPSTKDKDAIAGAEDREAARASAL